jgi:hypothetical protein
MMRSATWTVVAVAVGPAMTTATKTVVAALAGPMMRSVTWTVVAVAVGPVTKGMSVVEVVVDLVMKRMSVVAVVAGLVIWRRIETCLPRTALGTVGESWTVDAAGVGAGPRLSGWTVIATPVGTLGGKGGDGNAAVLASGRWGWMHMGVLPAQAQLVCFLPYPD